MIREQVFIEEQQVPPELEWDGLDPECIHVLATLGDGTAIGTARMLDGHIGRMCVLPEWRGCGAGRALLEALLSHAREQHIRKLVLNAQTGATGFYEKSGFNATGPVFMDAGIPHRRMIYAINE